MIARREGAPSPVESALDALGVEYDRLGDDTLVLTLVGTHRRSATVSIIDDGRTVVVRSFFMRHPEENREAFYRFLLQCNARTYVVSFCLDAAGDAFLVGRLPVAAISETEIDHVLGCVLTYSDEYFNAALRIGYASAIQRERAWRSRNRESTAHLDGLSFDE